MLDHIAEVCLSHFLCKFDPKSKKRLTKDVLREIALPMFSEEKVNEFVDYRLTKFQQTLVEEFNDRSAGKRPLRFQIADTAGIVEMVAGYQPKRLAKAIRFQAALQQTTPAEFETLA